MSRRILLSALLAAASLLGATEIREYKVRLGVQADGTSKGTGSLKLAKPTPGVFRLPLGIPKPKDLKLVDGPPGSEITLVPTEGQALLQVTLPPGAPAEASLTFSFVMAQGFTYVESGKGSGATKLRMLSHSFVNTQETEIKSYRFEALLPQGLMVQAIREQLPKTGKSEAEPRVRLGKIDGCQSATLQFTKVKQGDDASMSVEVVPVQKSWTWLLVGVVLAGLYVYYFKDLVSDKRP